MARTVQILDVNVTRARFPNINPGTEQALTNDIRQGLVTQPATLSLDQLLAMVQTVQREQQALDESQMTWTHLQHKARAFPILLVMASALCLGCGKRVLVYDSAGQPVAGADVQPQSLSMNGQATRTDAHGEARISLTLGGQEVKWISVAKPGFDPIQVEVPTKWPLRVTLPAAGTFRLG